MRDRLLLSSCVLLVPLLTLPQQLLAQQPPEAQRLGVFVGEWTFDELEGEATCAWLGDMAVHCPASWLNSEGDTIEAVFLTRWDAEAEVYTAHRFYSSGYADSGLAWVDGDTWTTVFEGPEGARYRNTSVISGDTWTYEWHMSVEGGPWEAGETGSATRAQ